MDVRDIDTKAVRAVLEQRHERYPDQTLWCAITKQANDLRGHIERILTWADAEEYRSGKNPAQWQGHLKKLLPDRNELRKVQGRDGLPYSHIYQLMSELRGREGVAVRAVEFQILCAARPGEVIKAKWSEIIEDRLWIRPASHMKNKQEHCVPLSPRATEILQALPRVSGNDFIFAGSTGRGLSNNTMVAVLKRMGYRRDSDRKIIIYNFPVTIHGFRKTFSNWANEVGHFERQVIEAALSHTKRDKVEATYHTEDLLPKRIPLMNKWAEFCAKPPAKIESIVTVARNARRA
jgi:integrase